MSKLKKTILTALSVLTLGLVASAAASATEQPCTPECCGGGSCDPNTCGCESSCCK